MPLPSKINLAGLDLLQARMLVQLWQQFIHARSGDAIGATQCFQETIMLCRANHNLAVDMGERMEKLHETIGCGDDCIHKKEGT